MENNKKRFITDRGLALLLEKKKVTFHEDWKCSYLTRRGGKGTELSEQEYVDSMSLLTPCSCCCEKLVVEKPAPLPAINFPVKAMITVWTCSDGHEFYGDKGENEALWYELELTKRRLNK